MGFPAKKLHRVFCRDTRNSRIATAKTSRVFTNVFTYVYKYKNNKPKIHLEDQYGKSLALPKSGFK